jgi:hypothetical protein
VTAGYRNVEYRQGSFSGRMCVWLKNFKNVYLKIFELLKYASTKQSRNWGYLQHQVGYGISSEIEIRHMQFSISDIVAPLRALSKALDHKTLLIHM